MPALPDGWGEDDSINDRLDAINTELQFALSELGFDNIGDIVRDTAGFEEEDIRAGQYSSLMEALLDMSDTAIFEFCYYYYDPISDTWGVIVDYEGD